MTRKRKNRLENIYDKDPDLEVGFEDWVHDDGADVEMLEEDENMTYKRIVGGSVLLLLGIFAFVWGFSAPAEFTYKPVQFDKFSYSQCFANESSDRILPASMRVIFMVIDAWRISFLTDPSSPMTFIRSSVNSGRAVAFKANVEAPTVTMPKIKSLTSGTIPSFTSFVSNFASSAATEDNWVKKAKDEGKRIHFFGDDTWLRLFPNTFERHDGVTSFYVNDYTEVDDNVTRHLRSEIETEEWDILILHYLGLDHIGHSLGGDSPQIPLKLKEMDDVVRDIFERASARFPTVLVVVGDHGMTKMGSHGGGSESETWVPLVFFHSTVNIIGGQNLDRLSRVEQVDVAPTLSLFLRTRTPSKSIGLSLIPRMAKYWQINNLTVFYDSFITATHLSRYLQRQPFIDHMFRIQVTSSLEQKCKMVRGLAIAALGKESLRFYRRMQEDIINSVIGVWVQSVIAGIFSTMLALLVWLKIDAFLLNRSQFKLRMLLTPSCFFTLFPFGLAAISTFSSSFVEEEHEIWYFLATFSICYQCTGPLNTYLKAIFGKDQNAASTVWPTFRSGFYLLLLHRLAMCFTMSRRRRWIMDADLLPGPIFSEFHFTSLHASFLDSFVNTSPEHLVKNIFPLTSTVLCAIVVFWIIRPIRSRDSYYRVRSFFIALAEVLVITRALLATLDIQSYGIDFNSKILFVLFLLCFSSPSCAAILYLFYLVKVETFPIVLICFKMGLLMRTFSSSHFLLAILCQAVFFYQGNSSGLATIDIAVGYRGLSYYEPLLVGLQVLVNLYAGPIALLLGYQFRSGPGSVLFMPYSLISVRTLLLTTSMLSMFFLSNHLFAYSVFAPKVMCEILHSIFVIVLTCVHFTCSYLSGIHR